MTTQKTAGHDDTRPAFEWQGLQLFAEEEGGAGDGAGVADAAATAEGAAADGTGGQVSKDPAATGVDAAKDGEAADPKVDGGDKKPDDAKAEDDKGEDGPPEKYDIDVPEGYEVDEKVLTRFEDFAKKANLNNELANEAAALHMEIMQDAFKALNEARNKEVEGWGKEAEKELGKDKDETLRYVAIGIKEAENAGIKNIKQDALETGAGNKLSYIKVLALLGRVLGEDQGGKDQGGKSAGNDDLANLLFPNSQK